MSAPTRGWALQCLSSQLRNPSYSCHPGWALHGLWAPPGETVISSSKTGKETKSLGSSPSEPSEPGVSSGDRCRQAERAAPACAVARGGEEAPAPCRFLSAFLSRQGLLCTSCFSEQQKRLSCSPCPWSQLLQDGVGARTRATGERTQAPVARGWDCTGEGQLYLHPRNWAFRRHLHGAPSSASPAGQKHP